jgi:hypothetical protein
MTFETAEPTLLMGFVDLQESEVVAVEKAAATGVAACWAINPASGTA